MRIAICSLQQDSEDYAALHGLLREHTDGAELLFSSYDEVFEGRLPAGISAVFACVDDMRSLEGARKLKQLNIPTVLVSGSPDYAMEGIRLNVCHYIIRPTSKQDVVTALSRLEEREAADIKEGGAREDTGV